jgi:hypothetical protein
LLNEKRFVLMMAAAATGLFLVFTLFTAPLFSMIAFTPAGGGGEEPSPPPPDDTGGKGHHQMKNQRPRQMEEDSRLNANDIDSFELVK